MYRARDSLDLFVVFALALTTTLIVAVTEGPSALRILLGFVFVLFLPGYTLMALLFPRRQDLGALERWVLSAGLSVPVVTLVGLALNYTPWGIRTLPMCTGLSLFIALCGVFVHARRTRIAREERFTLTGRSPAVLLGAGAFVVTLSLVATVIGFSLALRPAALTTAFYVYGDGGELRAYPHVVGPGDPLRLTVGVSNYEGETQTFRITASGEDEEQPLRILELENGATWEGSLAVNSPTGEGEQALQLHLYRGDELEAYRSLRLFLEVEGNGAP